MAQKCPHCPAIYTKGLSNHLRVCTEYIFSVHQYPSSENPATGTGPLIPVTRVRVGEENKIVCRCINGQGQLCHRLLAHQKSLYAHLKRMGVVSWQVRNTPIVPHIFTQFNEIFQMPAAVPDAPAAAPLPIIAEEPSAPVSPVVSHILSQIFHNLIYSAAIKACYPPNSSPLSQAHVSGPQPWPGLQHLQDVCRPSCSPSWPSPAL